MRHDDETTLLDIVRALGLIVEFIEGEDEDSFLHNEMVQSAVLHQFMVVGEATKRLSEDFRNRNDHIKWKQIAGMRDRLIHGYDGVDVSIVWETATSDVPLLRKQIALRKQTALLIPPGRETE